MDAQTGGKCRTGKFIPQDVEGGVVVERLGTALDTKLEGVTSQSAVRDGSTWCCWRHPAAPGEARALEPAFDNTGVAYRVAYGPTNGPIPAVLSVAEVRLGNTSVFQDRSIRPLWHLSAVYIVIGSPRVPAHIGSVPRL